jgi:rhodanese-related sulfurtransferase
MAEVKEIDAATVKAWIDAGEAVLVDVREREEFDQARIPGATLVPMSSFDPADLPRSEGRKLVFHCAVGQRSHSVAEYVLNEGVVDEAYNMTGGIQAWAAAGLPVESGG